MPVLRPMFASPAREQTLGAGWRFEPKLDGWRALVTVDGKVTVRTRTGRDVTESLPELVRDAHRVLAAVAAAEDAGELVVEGAAADGVGLLGLVAGQDGQPRSRQSLSCTTTVCGWVQQKATLDRPRTAVAPAGAGPSARPVHRPPQTRRRPRQGPRAADTSVRGT